MCRCETQANGVTFCQYKMCWHWGIKFGRKITELELKRTRRSNTTHILSDYIYLFLVRLHYHINLMYVPKVPFGTDEFLRLSLCRLWKQLPAQSDGTAVTQWWYFSNKQRNFPTKIFNYGSTKNWSKWSLRFWVACITRNLSWRLNWNYNNWETLYREFTTLISIIKRLEAREESRFYLVFFQ